MWKPISNCGTQLNSGFRIRQTIRDEAVYTIEYKITEINMDEYVLQLVAKTKNGEPVQPDPAEVLVFSCGQIIEEQFEVWVQEQQEP